MRENEFIAGRAQSMIYWQCVNDILVGEVFHFVSESASSMPGREGL
jgi:hypothetical protein